MAEMRRDGENSAFMTAHCKVGLEEWIYKKRIKTQVTSLSKIQSGKRGPLG